MLVNNRNKTKVVCERSNLPPSAWTWKSTKWSGMALSMLNLSRMLLITVLVWSEFVNWKNKPIQLKSNNWHFYFQINEFHFDILTILIINTSISRIFRFYWYFFDTLAVTCDKTRAPSLLVEGTYPALFLNTL